MKKKSAIIFLYKLISREKRKRLPYVLTLALFGAAFEVAGIGLIIPLIDYLTNNNSGSLKFITTFIDSELHYDLPTLLIILLTFVFAVKGIYLTVMAYIIARFSYSIKEDIANKLMARYLQLPYVFHLSNDKSALVRNITMECNNLISYAINPLLTIFVEFFMAAGLLIFLFLISPLTTSSLIIFISLLSFGFYKTVGAYSLKVGQKRQQADALVIKSTQENLYGIRDIKLSRNEKFFIDTFKTHNSVASNMSAMRNFLGQTPRIYLETFSVIILLIIILISIKNNVETVSYLSTISVIALSAVRLIPSGNRILTAFNSLKYAEPVVTVLYDHVNNTTDKLTIKQSREKFNSDWDFSQNLEVQSVSFSYSKDGYPILNDICLNVEHGQSIGIIGLSGSGKSTLLDLILGLIQPASGMVKLGDKNIHTDIQSWQEMVGYVQQDTFIVDGTIRSNVAFGFADETIDDDRVKMALRDSSLEEFVEALPDGVHSILGPGGINLSGGQQQRICIARALYKDAPIMIFDEATSALDNETEAEIVSVLKSLAGSRTIIIVAHRKSTIQHCDVVYSLSCGVLNKSEQLKD